MKFLQFDHGHPELDSYDGGYRANPEGVQRFMDVLRNGPSLFAAAPHLAEDEPTSDLMPYLAMYELELKNADGTVWKQKGDEMPYRPQTGYNCTSEGGGRGIDDLQILEIADALTHYPEDGKSIVWHRTCIEYMYAAGLFKAGMRGDNGCYGAAIAQALHEIGVISYDIAGEPYEESHQRLVQWANNPQSAVEKFQDKAASFRVVSIAKCTSYKEARATIANRGFVTVASNVGFNRPRDERGICRRAGSWAHQMRYFGSIESDGTPSMVQFQSWGKNQPSGPQPFKLPSYAFRVVQEDVEAQLAAGDSFSVFGFPGFEKRPLPPRFTNCGWGR